MQARSLTHSEANICQEGGKAHAANTCQEEDKAHMADVCQELGKAHVQQIIPWYRWCAMYRRKSPVVRLKVKLMELQGKQIVSRANCCMRCYACMVRTSPH